MGPVISILLNPETRRGPVILVVLHLLRFFALARYPGWALCFDRRPTLS